MAQTGWLSPSTTDNFGWSNPNNVLVLDGQYATAADADFTFLSLYIGGGGTYYDGGSITPPSSSSSRTYSININKPASELEVSFIVELDAFGTLLDIDGYDLSTLPSDSVVTKVEVRMTHFRTSGVWSVDFVDVRLTYAVTISPSTISSAQSFGSPSVTPGAVTISADSMASSEAFGIPSYSLKAYPDSVLSAESFGTLLITLPLASIGGIASTESVSNVSFTTRYINPSTIGAAESFGTPLVIMYGSDFGGITSEEAVTGPTFVQSDPPPPPPSDWSAVGKEDEKEYIYKVYDADGNYIGIWTDVKDSLQYTQQINTPGTTTTVQLTRSADTSKEARTARITEDGEERITEDGDTRVVVFETPNSVGEDTDVELNYNVDVYVHYGEFEERITQEGEVRITEDGEERIVTSGAPLGVRVFSGFIMDYESTYGETAGVTVTLASHGYELSNELIRDGETTTVEYSGTEVGAGVKDILDDNPGKMGYSTASIDATGVTTDLKFQLNTKLEGIQAFFSQTDDDWYWFGNVADNNVYMKQTSATPDHVFILGKHIKSIAVKRSIESLKNVVYFVGGQTDPDDPATTVFKKYEDTTSQTNWRKGLERITDRRYTNTTSMQQRADKTLGRYKDPIFATPLTITSARYDLESIKLGQTVGFRNFGNFIDDVVLQIVSLSYASTEVTVQLGELQERQVDTVAGLDEDLANEQYQNLPTAPS